MAPNLDPNINSKLYIYIYTDKNTYLCTYLSIYLVSGIYQILNRGPEQTPPESTGPITRAIGRPLDSRALQEGLGGGLHLGNWPVLPSLLLTLGLQEHK